MASKFYERFLLALVLLSFSIAAYAETLETTVGTVSVVEEPEEPVTIQPISDCEMARGYCTYFEDECKTGYVVGEFACFYKSEKCCVLKEVTVEEEPVECDYYTNERGCRIVKCSDGTYKEYCPEPLPVVECKEYKDEKGCLVVECADGSVKRDCPEELVGGVVEAGEVECRTYSDEKGCRITKCSDGTYKEYCPEPLPAITCKDYKDEEGCMVVECSDGSIERRCPVNWVDSLRECKTYSEDNCRVQVCDDGSYEKYCPTVTDTTLACKEYKDERGCLVVECTDGTSKVKCATPTTVYAECKYYVDREGCRVKECTDGSKDVSCPTTIERECKTYQDETGCYITKCVDGSVYEKCVAEELIEAPTCKTYVDEEGCKITKCTDGIEKKYCPLEPPGEVCETFIDERECKVTWCKAEGVIDRECPQTVCPSVVRPPEEVYERCENAGGKMVSPEPDELGCIGPPVCIYPGEECVCTAEYAPVCGVDGRTYSNKCQARCAHVEVSSEGKCTIAECNGCFYKESCLPFGTRIEEKDTPMYCSINKEFTRQAGEGVSCQNDYECTTNECSNGECISTAGLIQKLINLLSRIFG